MLRQSLTTAVAVALAAALMTTIEGARAAYDAKYPDWKGQWERFAIRLPTQPSHAFIFQHAEQFGLQCEVNLSDFIQENCSVMSGFEAPGAIGAYSQAVRSGSLLFCSGQIPLDPKSGQIVSGDITAQTRRVLDNIAALLRAEGLNFDDVVKTTVFLTNLDDFQIVNEVYGSYFKQNPPARSTVQVSALPRGVNVEIEVIAATHEPEQTAYDTSG